MQAADAYGVLTHAAGSCIRTCTAAARLRETRQRNLAAVLCHDCRAQLKIMWKRGKMLLRTPNAGRRFKFKQTQGVSAKQIWFLTVSAGGKKRKKKENPAMHTFAVSLNVEKPFKVKYLFFFLNF